MFLSCGKESAQLCTTITAFPRTSGVLYKSTIIIITYAVNKLCDGNTQVRKPHTFYFTSIKLLPPPPPPPQKKWTKWHWKIADRDLLDLLKLRLPVHHRRQHKGCCDHHKVDSEDRKLQLLLDFTLQSIIKATMFTLFHQIPQGFPHNIHPFPSEFTGLALLIHAPQCSLFSTRFHRAFPTIFTLFHQSSQGLPYSTIPTIFTLFHQIPQGFPHNIHPFPSEFTGLALLNHDSTGLHNIHPFPSEFTGLALLKCPTMFTLFHQIPQGFPHNIHPFPSEFTGLALLNHAPQCSLFSTRFHRAFPTIFTLFHQQPCPTMFTLFHQIPQGFPHNIHPFPSEFTGLALLNHAPQCSLFSTRFHRAFPTIFTLFHQSSQGLPYSTMPHNVHSFPPDSTGLSPQYSPFSIRVHRACPTHPCPTMFTLFHQLP